VPDAVHLPLSELRERHGELPRDRELWLYCAAGQRAYYATRFLAQHGFRPRNLSGGYTTWQAFEAAKGRTRA
jgi:rhodanese-related sulfurtransferase